MDKLSKDVLFSIALELDLPELLRFCMTCQRINQKICQQPYIWLNKLKKDFSKDDVKIFNDLTSSPKETYELMYKLKELNRKVFELDNINFNYSLIELYNLQTLDLSENQISVIPPEIGQLINLQYLYLYGNQISVIPTEIGQLTNLKY